MRAKLVLTILTISGTAMHAATSVICGAAFGAQFNLEPNTNAVPQQLEAVDFLPNRIGSGLDLVVGGAYDFRGAGLGSPAPNGVIWDGSVSGYYVHRSTTNDCSAQFEGGLPSIVSSGTTYLGNGGVAVAADPPRDAFFVADLRFGSTNNVSAIGLFRASSATLLNPALCANGTHTAAQAASCWEASPAVVVSPNPPGSLTATLDFPSVTVDERQSGVGAGDVYVAFGNFKVSGGGISLVACTNATLACSAPIIISSNSPPFGSVDANVQVRPDGKITVTYVDQNSTTSNTIHFVICTPSGAPNAPVCSPATVVANETQPLFPTTPASGASMSNLNLPVFTAARHADRQDSGGIVTTFVVWDRCQTTYQNSPGGTCLKAQVVMSTSTDGGATWSAPVTVNTGTGHQFFPWISADVSTGTVNIVYYNTAGDTLHKRITVSLNQIPAGSTTPGAPIAITSTPAPWDADPTQNPLVFGFDLHFGMKSRGVGIAGQSRVYTSFTSTADRKALFSGSALPEQNNNLQKLTY